MSTDEFTHQSSTDTDQHTRPDTLFQQRILFIISGFANQRYETDAYSNNDAYGLAIKEKLEQRMDEEVNHGRLYPNLDDLVEKGLITKDELDKRTNRYELTPAGRNYIRDELQWEAGCIGRDVEVGR